MPSFEFSMRIDAVTVARNGRSNLSSVKNRFLVQMVAPAGTDHPTSTFVVPTSFDGAPVPTAEIEDDLPFRLAFKLEDFESVFGEPLKLRFHHFQDTQRDQFQLILGRLVNLAIDGLLGGVQVLGVKLDKLIKLTDNLDLDEKTYSQKLGAIDIELTPDDFVDGTLTRDLSLEAPSTVRHLRFVGANPTPQRRTVVAEGGTTADLTVSMRLVPA